MKPIIKWSGGKADEIEMIKQWFPKHYDTYYEPFVGGGALFFYLDYPKNVINDVHPELIALYRAIQNGHALKIHDMCKENWPDHTENREKKYYFVRDDFKVNDDVDKAFRFYFLMKTCFRGMLRYNSKGEFNIPWGNYKKVDFSTILNPKYEQLLKKTNIMSGDFEEVYKLMTKDDFVFLDPPYDTPFSDYGYCQFGREHHKRLADCFKNSEAQQLMVISKTDFIFDLYKDYIIGSYDKQYKFRIYGKRVDSDNIDKPHLVIANNLKLPEVKEELTGFA